MYLSCYLVKNKVMIPSQARIGRAGPRIMIAPVAYLPLDQTYEIKQAIVDYVNRGMFDFDALTPEERDRTILLKLSGVKSWPAFDRIMQGTWYIDDVKGYYQLTVGVRQKVRGWQDGPESYAFSPGAPITEVCDRLIPLIQARAAGATA